MTLTLELIKDGNDAVEEMLAGLIEEHLDRLWRPEQAPRAIFRPQAAQAQSRAGGRLRGGP